jgi:integrase
MQDNSRADECHERAETCPDPFAVQRLLGHANLKMATTYVQDVSEQTDRAINNTRKLIIQGDSSLSADAPGGMNG